MDSLPFAEIKFKDFPKFTNSDIINKEISNLFTLICNDFIARWFFLISEDQDEEFIEEIVKVIDYLIKDIEIRLKKVKYIYKSNIYLYDNNLFKYISLII